MKRRGADAEPEEEAKTYENSISLTLTLGHVLPHGLRKDFQVASPVWIAILESFLGS